MLVKEFKSIYSLNVFEINEFSAFQFGGRSVRDLKNECKNIRQLSRKLASAESFNNNQFESLATRFNISIEAMAIRLEELRLVIY